MGDWVWTYLSLLAIHLCFCLLSSKFHSAGLSDDTTSHSDARNDTSACKSPCIMCDPVLKQLKLHFDWARAWPKKTEALAFKPEEARQATLPEPGSPEQVDLLDALGNYKYCQRCITLILKIGTQRLAYQRAVKQNQAHAPLVHMTKSEVLADHLEE